MVANTLAAILNEGQSAYQYRDSQFSESGMSIATVVRPNWWLLLSTAMYIDIESREANLSVVTVRTKSQWFILGDIFNFYRGYLNDVLG